ncbi:dihydrofolate reductase family protein [Microcella daejeonensis]|uniref:dihydrofolate reductase family protein n=1 Tax=Microcella daejeonensis TaxID=2994971 RepID=UPI00226DA55B|nr:dihydrofolate reductase family protein [Microcella daejeonensis]WAB84243.1 dihydrofolate reductase family protein [Microcella daejeonensis]
MRELIYFIATSIDGRIADGDGATDGFSTDPELYAALAREVPESIPAHLREALGARLDPARARWTTVLMGRRTYQPALDAGIASPYAPLEQIVVSRTLRPSGAEGEPRFVSDPVAVVRELREREGGGIWLCGGGELAGALADEIDRLIVKVNPVLLGDGVPLLGGPAMPGPWRLESTRTLPGGVVMNEYVRARG